MSRRAAGFLVLALVAAGPAGLPAQAAPPSLEVLELRARRDSNDAVAHHDLAMAYRARKKWAYLRGVVALHLGQADLARTALERFLTLTPSRMTEQVADAKARLEGIR